MVSDLRPTREAVRTQIHLGTFCATDDDAPIGKDILKKDYREFKVSDIVVDDLVRVTRKMVSDLRPTREGIKTHNT